MPEQQAALPPEERVGWAVMGLGDFACNQILPAFAACTHSKLVALVSGDRTKAERTARQYGVPDGNVYTYDTLDRIAENKAVDVIYIITPNALHSEHAMRAATAGKHVFCEKPMAPSSGECQAMINVCERAGRRLGIGYRVHFEPYNLEAMRLLRDGKIGALKLIVADHARILNPAEPQDTWRAEKALAGGGSLVDIGIYSLNAARWFAGEEPISVQASLHSTPGDWRFREVEESVSFTLRFPSGVIANCTSSYGAERVKRYRLIGSEGYLDLDPATEYSGNRLVVGTKQGREERTVKPSSQFAGEIDHFSQCILQKKEPEIGGAMGTQDVRVIEAIYRAAASGNTETIGR